MPFVVVVPDVVSFVIVVDGDFAIAVVHLCSCIGARYGWCHCCHGNCSCACVDCASGCRSRCCPSNLGFGACSSNVSFVIADDVVIVVGQVVLGFVLVLVLVVHVLVVCILLVWCVLLEQK